jgi:hypothetical protein
MVAPESRRLSALFASLPFRLIPLVDGGGVTVPLNVITDLTQSHAPRILIIVEQDASIDQLCELIAQLPTFCCICPPSMLTAVQNQLGQSVDLSRAELVPLSNDALKFYSAAENDAGAHAQQVTKLIVQTLTKLVALLPEAQLLARHVPVLAITLESTVYSQFSVVISVLKSCLQTSRFDCAIVVPSAQGADLPLARMVMSLADQIPAWMLSSSEMENKHSERVRSWSDPSNLRACPAGQSKIVQASHVSGLKSLVDHLRQEEQGFAAVLERYPSDWYRCGLLVAQNTDALGIGSAAILKGLTEILPVIAVALGLSDTDRAGYWDSMMAAGPAANCVRQLEVELPSGAFKPEAEFLLSYLSNELTGSPIFTIGNQDFSFEALSVIANRLRLAYPTHLIGLARARAIVKTFCPEFVFAYPGAHVYARLLVAAARDFGIPTFDVQSLFISRHPRNIVHWSDTADVIMAMDNQFASTLREYMNWPSDRVVVTGTPRLDVLIATKGELTRESARSGFSDLSPTARIVSFFTQNGQKRDNVRILEALVQMTHDIEDVQIVTKMHPRSTSDEIAVIKDFVARVGGRCIIVNRGDTFNLIRASDVIATKYSNIALEGAVLDRPVLLFNFDREQFDPNLETWGVGEPIYAFPHGRRLLKAILKGGRGRAAKARRHQQAFFERNPQYKDGRATERIMNVVKARIRP